MPHVHVVRSSPLAHTSRVRQLSGMFDAPLGEAITFECELEMPLDERPWSIGLITGPSGTGKTSVARELWGEEAIAPDLDWGSGAVADSFSPEIPIEEIARICGAVGFNTIPSWMKPFSVLSMGEQFRVTLARVLAESRSNPIVFDEFTSVVDRQVARIGCAAVAKEIRRSGKRFVAVSCHDDIIDWLQPDWVARPSERSFAWRSVQRRPAIEVEIAPVDAREYWPLFAPYHYLTAELSSSAKFSFVAFVNKEPVGIAAWIYRPSSRAKQNHRPVVGLSRIVVLPDWQGVGIARVLSDYTASIWRVFKSRPRAYPAHPALIRSYDRSPLWEMVKRPGVIPSVNEALYKRAGVDPKVTGRFGGRPCATFEYVGPLGKIEDAQRLMSLWPDAWFWKYRPDLHPGTTDAG